MPVVVIVDDRATNLRILRRCAERLGEDVVVHTYRRASEALEGLREDLPDLIVTDYVMPGMTGEQFIQSCRESTACSDVPIIVVTAFEDTEYRYRALDAGASDFLLSPVDAREFCIRARHLLTIREQQEALRMHANSLESELANTLLQHAEEIQQREQNLRRIVNTVPALISASDEKRTITLLNDYHERIFDFSIDDVSGKDLHAVFDPDYVARHNELDLNVMRGRRTLPGIEEVITDRNGNERVFLTTKAPLEARGSDHAQVVTVSLDITERKRSERALRESEQRFRNLVESSVFGIVITRDGKPLFANKTYASIFGYEDSLEILAMDTLSGLFAQPDPTGQSETGEVRLEKDTLDRYEVQGVRKDGSLIWVEAQLQKVTWEERPAVQQTVTDITLRKEYEDELERQANFDEITDLPNRVLALDRLRGAIISAQRHNHNVGVLFLDLDNFKKINDTLGHATGDQLLKKAAERLTRCIRAEDTVARLGGDEFTVILPKLNSAAHAEPVIQKILDTFSAPFILGADEVFVSVSIGVTVAPEDGLDAHILMQNADAAMYRAKEQGRNTFQYFTKELNWRAVERMRLESHLVHALSRNELQVHYQPILDLNSFEIIGAEALLRWSDPVLGNVVPERFIPLAEDTGMIVPIGSWVLDTVARQMEVWNRKEFPPLRMSVNISSRQFRGSGILDIVKEILGKYNIGAHLIELEITEGLLLDELPQTNENLRELASRSIRLSLDDFGTGYSSLKYLSQFPVNTLKIDKSFVADVATDPDDATVVEAIIAMAHRLGLQVIGEGIETAEQLEFMHKHECDLAQGFYFSEPLPAEEFEHWVIAQMETARTVAAPTSRTPPVAQDANTP